LSHKTKKIVAILLSLVMAFSMVGCSPARKAEKTVDKMFSAIERADFQAAEKYIDLGNFDPEQLDESPVGEADVYVKCLLDSVEHEIISSEEIDENTVNVTVDVTTVALGPVLGDFATEAMAYALSSAFDDKPSEEEISKDMAKLFKEVMSKDDLKMNTNEVVIKVVKDDKNWTIAGEDTLVSIIFGDVENLLNTINDVLSL